MLVPTADCNTDTVWLETALLEYRQVVFNAKCREQPYHITVIYVTYAVNMLPTFSY